MIRRVRIQVVWSAVVDVDVDAPDAVAVVKEAVEELVDTPKWGLTTTHAELVEVNPKLRAHRRIYGSGPEEWDHEPAPSVKEDDETAHYRSES